MFLKWPIFPYNDSKSWKKLFVSIISLGVLFFLNGCVFLPKPTEQVKQVAEIESFYQKWRGTNYQYGGNNGAGIDCSALMVEVYDDLYGIKLPRTTEAQADKGERVRLKNLRTGDLVFFKTGILQRHVGIYLEDGIFVHASASKGVIKSSLLSGYWRDHYWKTKRISN